MRWIPGVLGGLTILAGIVSPVVKAVVTRAELTKDVIRKGARTTLAIAAVGLVLLLFSSAVVQVEAGHVGVVKQFGAVTGTKFEPGLHFRVPPY